MKRRKNIAIYVAMLENEFSYAVLEGAIMGAKEIDANLYIFPAGILDAKYDDLEANCYRYQYNTLYSCINSKSMDAVIIEYGTVTSFLNEQQKKDFLATLGDVPVMLLAGREAGYSSICVDNRVGLSEAILHLIEKHHCSRIGFVSGPATSQDAMERLEVYKAVMRQQGLEPSEDWIVYGNFSEFSEEVVEDLITRHPDIEAIVCANDQMASGAYNTLKKLGKVPGKDILITGFDDSPTAMLLEPHLTSVKADTKEMAYMAVLECANLKAGDCVDKTVASRLIVRESCGCGDVVISETEQVNTEDKFDEQFVKQLAEETFEKYANNYFESSETKQMRHLLLEYMDYFLHLVDSDGMLSLEYEEFVREYMRFSQLYRKGYMDLNLFLSINFMLYGQVSGRIVKEQERLCLLEKMSAVNQEFMTVLAKEKMVADEKAKVFEIILTNITRDMLQFSNSEKKKYASVISKLRRMGIASGYILTYGKGIVHTEGEKWIQPETLYVKAYHNLNEDYLFSGKERSTKLNSLFASKLMPQDRRYNMLVMPMFSGEEQYGLMLTESELSYFRYASQIACQVSVSMEVIEILKKQSALKLELEKNLARAQESNRVLDAMSQSDALTGIANRRGYMNMVGQMLSDSGNQGKRAVAVYADMDCLKIVNDEFGHDEGDYALKLIATALKESFRKSDVVARMGGDEFAAFAIINDAQFAVKLKERIQNILKKLNENTKPYYVNMSIGTYEFVIQEGVDLEAILNFADEQLYIEKRNKVKVVYKER